MDLNGKRALVTGASRGIGLAITHALLEAGAQVVATSKNRDNLQLIEGELGKTAPQLRTIVADLRDEAEVEKLCRELSTSGSPEIIINNAGVLHFDVLENLTLEQIHDSFAVNVIAPMLICRAFIPSMIQARWGRIANICSSSSYSGGYCPGHCAYSASKHALLGFSRALDEELRDYDIRVSTVSPAGVRTDMTSNRTDLDYDSLMTPGEVAQAVMFQLTSDGPGIAYEIRLWRLHR